jgi:hypothetical protein
MLPWPLGFHARPLKMGQTSLAFFGGHAGARVQTLVDSLAPWSFAGRLTPTLELCQLTVGQFLISLLRFRISHCTVQFCSPYKTGIFLNILFLGTPDM